jgi:hypothetical protein
MHATSTIQHKVLVPVLYIIYNTGNILSLIGWHSIGFHLKDVYVVSFLLSLTPSHNLNIDLRDIRSTCITSTKIPPPKKWRFFYFLSTFCVFLAGKAHVGCRKVEKGLPPGPTPNMIKYLHSK